MAMVWILVLVVVAALALAWTARKYPQALTQRGLALERRWSGLKLHVARDVEGFDIPYLEGGQGDALLLVHGFGGDKDNFTRMARHLVPHYRVIIPDLPGFGDATRLPDARYRMDDQVRRLHRLLQGLGVQRAWVGGNSMGGFLASEMAAQLPEMVSGVWLIDAAGTAAAYDNALFHEYRATGRAPLLLRQPDDIHAMVRATMARPPWFPGFVLQALGLRGVADLPLHTRILQELADHSPLLEQRYQRLGAPALIVWGEKDAILNPAAAATQQLLFPNHRLRVMPGIGHVPMLEAPRQTATDFLDWARSVRAPG